MTYTLRDLPLPVKVVASVFLMAVGVGYTSAILQLHIQDAKSGKPMPTVEDVVLKFTGKKKADPNAPPPRAVSRLEALVTSETVAITGASMAGAFTTQDQAAGALKDLKYANAIKSKPPEVVKAERKGEQIVFALWINTPDEARKAAYEADKFSVPADQMPPLFTPALRDGGAVKIKTLIDARCVPCHSKGGEKEDPALDTYAGLERFMAASAPAAPVGGYVKVEEPISISKLTQSTHAHLLSFATLFSLTGLIFAFSSWPAWIRTILGPWVVIAVFADVSMWWLARLCDEWGPYFAMGVIATGGAAGLGLAAQITLSLFNMYGFKGKVVIALLFGVGAVAGGGFVTKLLIPALPKPKVEEKKGEDKKPADKSSAEGIAAMGGAITGALTKTQAVAVTLRRPVNEIERLLTWPPVDNEGKPVPPADIKFKGGDDGNMVAAFFEKDKAFKKFIDGDAPQPKKDELRAHRQGDLDTLLAWVRTPEPLRKGAYEADRFELPGLSDRTLTPEFVKDGKVKIKSLIDARCATCHSPAGKQADYPLDTYTGLSEYLKPNDAPAPKVDGNGGAGKPADPIPPAKDD